MRRWNALDWFRLGAGALIVSSVLLGALTLESALREKARADLSLAHLELFEAAFSVATTVMAERLPLETAFGNEASRNAAPMAEIRGTRISSDMAIRRFEDVATRTDLNGSMNFAFLRADLKATRTRADELLSRPMEKRLLGEQLSVMRAMIAASETLEPMVAKAGRSVVNANVDLSGSVSVARVLGSLYDSASRYSAQIMPVLKARQRLSPEVHMTALRTQERLLALWELGSSQIELGADAKELDETFQSVQRLYFGQGFPFLSKAIQHFSLRAPRGDESADRLSQVYRPTIEPIASLRDQYVSAMMANARADQARTVERALVAAGLVALIVLIVPMLVWTFYREVVRPLLQFRMQILQMCAGEIDPGPAYLGSLPAVSNLYHALETLRGREQERRALDRERADLSRRLRLLSETDDLTGVLNRRGLFEALSSFGAQDCEYAVVLCDIDHFKAVNDERGHDVGDEVLRAFGTLLQRRCEGSVVVARHGGEEFAMVLRGREQAPMLAEVEALREAVETLVVETRSGPPVRLTASFGVCFDRGPIEEWRDLLRSADGALYEAKSAGRNRVRATSAVADALRQAGLCGLAAVACEPAYLSRS